MRPGSTGKTNPTQKVPTPGTVNRPPATANKTTASKHNSKEFKDNFLKKIQFCSQSFDFNDDTKDTKEKVPFSRPLTLIKS